MSFNEFYNNAEKNYLQGNHVDAIKWYEKALPLVPAIRKDVLPKLHINLGHSYDYTGEVEKSRVNYNKVLDIAIETGNQKGKVNALVSLSLCDYRLNEYTNAISILQQAETLALRISYKEGLVDVYLQLSIIYDDFMSLSKAEDYALKAFSIIDEDRNAFEYRHIAHAYKTLANVQYSLHQYKKCRDNLEKAEIYDKLSKNKTSQSMTIRNLGLTCLAQKDYPNAAKYLKKSLSLFISNKNQLEITWCYYNLGIAYRLTKDSDTKITLDIALKKAHKNDDPELIGYIHRELGYYYLEIDKNKSYEHLKISIQYHQKLREKVIYYEHHVGLSSRLGHDAFDSLIRLCIELDKDEEAFQIFDESKSFSFARLMRTSKINPKLKSNELNSYLDEEEKYLSQLRVKQTSYSSYFVKTDKDEVTELIDKLNDLYDKMELIDPEYVNLRRAKTVTIQELKQISTESDIIFLQYFISTENMVYIFVVSGSVFDVVSVSLPSSLREYYISFKKLTDPEKYEKFMTNINWTDLSNYLIIPVEKYLQNNKIICFVPSGGLYHIPLHCLNQNGDFIIKRHPIFYCASSSLFRFYRTRKGMVPITCGAFALDDEPFLFKAEARDVAEIFNSQPVIDVKKKDMVHLIKDKDILHLATHGEFIDESPMDSYVVLNRSEILEAGEIFNLEIQSSLVTLSACESGVSEIKSGDELIGLTHSLLYSGAASVVVSLWKVGDESTCELMSDFYENLKAKMRKVEALQNAQIKLINNGKNVKQWAPFIMTGNFE